jgi:hypothetical protein
MTCPSCKQPCCSSWHLVEYEDNRVPRWERTTDCCGVRTGWHIGYKTPDGSRSVAPQLGLNYHGMLWKPF